MATQTIKAPYVPPHETYMSFGQINGNANDIYTSGSYRCVSGSISNVPVSDGILIVFRADAMSCFQLFIDWEAGMKKRIHWGAGTGGTWTAWTNV